MNVPFSIFNTEPSTEETTVRTRRVRENATVLNNTTEVQNRLNTLSELGLFSDAALANVRERADRVKSLNVFMLCWAYEVIIALNKERLSKDRSRAGNGV